MRVPVTSLTAMLMLGSAAAAEPPKTPPAKQPASANPRADIVLASADSVRVPAAEGSPSAQPARHRVAPRVTSCRCGDQQVDPETQEQ